MRRGFLFLGIAALLLEHPSARQVWQGMVPLLYVGVLSSGVGFTLQIVGQKKVSAPVASVAMSMEGVFAALAGWLLLGTALSPKEIIGCALMLAALLLAARSERDIQKQ